MCANAALIDKGSARDHFRPTDNGLNESQQCLPTKETGRQMCDTRVGETVAQRWDAADRTQLCHELAKQSWRSLLSIMSLSVCIRKFGM